MLTWVCDADNCCASKEAIPIIAPTLVVIFVESIGGVR